MLKRLDWKYFVMLIVTIIGAALPWWLPKIESSGKPIVVEITSSTNLQPFKAEFLQELQILIDGVPVNQPFLSSIKISNEGEKVISTKDFETPLYIIFGGSVILDKLKIENTSPPDVEAKVETEKSGFHLMPMLLNPGDSISITVLTSGGKPSIIAKTRIAGVSAISVVDGQTRKKNFLVIALMFLLSIIGLIPGIIAIDQWSPLDKKQLRVSFRKRTAFIIYLVSIGFSQYCGFLVLKEWVSEPSTTLIIGFGIVLFAIGAPIAFKFDKN